MSEFDLSNGGRLSRIDGTLRYMVGVGNKCHFHNFEWNGCPIKGRGLFLEVQPPFSDWTNGAA